MLVRQPTKQLYSSITSSHIADGLYSAARMLGLPLPHDAKKVGTSSSDSGAIGHFFFGPWSFCFGNGSEWCTKRETLLVAAVFLFFLATETWRISMDFACFGLFLLISIFLYRDHYVFNYNFISFLRELPVHVYWLHTISTTATLRLCFWVDTQYTGRTLNRSMI